MATPRGQKECSNEDVIPRRLLCAVKNPTTSNEILLLTGLKEPSNASADSASINAGAFSDEHSCEFYEDVLQEEKHFPSLGFMLAIDINSKQSVIVPVIVVTQRELANHPPFGLVSRVQVNITGRKYIVHILMREWEFGELEGRESIHALCNKLVANPEYKFCPGIDPEVYQSEYFRKIRFHLKSVCETLLAPNATLTEKKSTQVRCGVCKRLITDLKCQLQRTLKETPTRKLKTTSSFLTSKADLYVTS